MPKATKTRWEPEDPLLPRIRYYLTHCRELNPLCSQNGWIDNDTLRIEIESRDGAGTRVAVHFTEAIMEGGGCMADRRECFGKLIIAFDPDGAVRACTVV